MFSKPFDSFARFLELLRAAPAEDDEARAAAAARNEQLTKPPGALGRLEELAVWMAGWQGRAIPTMERPQVAVFAGNHGVAALGVSAFPSEVTAQMVKNFESGGAAVNQLAAIAGARLDVVPLSLEDPTSDFTKGPAMSVEGCLEALATGWSTVDTEADTLVVGEMGIGNTTAAAAIAASLEGGDWVGRGTGVDDAGLARKRAAVEAGLTANADAVGDPLATLAAFGGREIAAMAGAVAAARVHRIPVVLDGFIASTAALVLRRAAPGAIDHVIAGHESAEEAHPRLLAALGKEPLLSLGLRLGEGSGAALALQVIRCALACHGGMATFAEAGVSDG